MSPQGRLRLIRVSSRMSPAFQHRHLRIENAYPNIRLANIESQEDLQGNAASAESHSNYQLPVIRRTAGGASAETHPHQPHGRPPRRTSSTTKLRSNSLRSHSATPPTSVRVNTPPSANLVVDYLAKMHNRPKQLSAPARYADAKDRGSSSPGSCS